MELDLITFTCPKGHQIEHDCNNDFSINTSKQVFIEKIVKAAIKYMEHASGTRDVETDSLTGFLGKLKDFAR